MRVFLTGATGFVGSAVAQELIEAGREVVGLARSDAAVAKLEAAGIAAFRGDIDDRDSLRRGADAADGVIHTAFNHDFSTFAANCEADRAVIAALGEPLIRTGRALVVTSGIGVLPQGALLDETINPPTGPKAHPRTASEHASVELSARGGDVRIIRLPPSTHGVGDHGFVPMLIGMGREKGRSGYIRAGENRWPAVHRRDAARLYRLALEKGAAGERYHAVAEEGVPFRAIAEVIARRLGVPLAGLTAEQAAAHFGWFTHFAAMDVPASSARTRRALGWEPREIGLLEDIDSADYFAG